MGLRPAMEQMLTGDSMDGLEAVRVGCANRAFPAEELESRVIAMAERIAQVAPELVQLNKRLVHRQMEAMGMRTGIRVGTELCALGYPPEVLARVRHRDAAGPDRGAYRRDQPFGDYRTADTQPSSPPAPD